MPTKPKAQTRCERVSHILTNGGGLRTETVIEALDNAAAELRRQHGVIGEFARLGAAVLKELDEDQPDAPGHCHSRPGVWDDENEFRVAGQPCQWCATWGQFRALLNKHKE